uniref:Uncharacterized protein n=1 Tax=Ananas comosus var. bracteatus TaxID=296719 RepID=A0A6V7NPU5_ANACO|nr:unnamed protein product [Ananas comosus var. bracteatus]
MGSRRERVAPGGVRGGLSGTLGVQHGRSWVRRRSRRPLGRRCSAGVGLHPPVRLPFPSLKYACFIGTTSSAHRPSSATVAATAPPPNHRASAEPPRRESLQRPCRLPRDPQPRRSDLHRHHLLLPLPRPIWNNPATSGKILQASMRFSSSLSLSSSLSSPSSYTLLEVFLLAW